MNEAQPTAKTSVRNRAYIMVWCRERAKEIVRGAHANEHGIIETDAVQQYLASHLETYRDALLAEDADGSGLGERDVVLLAKRLELMAMNMERMHLAFAKQDYDAAMLLAEHATNDLAAALTTLAAARA